MNASVRFDVNKDGTVDREEILGLVKMMVSGFITSFGISNIDEDILDPYYNQLIDGLLKESKNGDFLTFEDFNVTPFDYFISEMYGIL